MSYEIIKNELKRENNPIHFLKWTTKYNELDETKIKFMNDFKKVFPFAERSDKDDNKFKNLKNTEFTLAWFKENKFKEKNNIRYFEISEKEYNIVKKINKLPDVQKLIPYSFILQATIKLTAPYFSRDDDNFYLIQNPCLKEKVFKVPMVRGSGWKGAIAACFRDLINESNDKRKLIQSYLRIFGAGSDEFRKLKESINEYVKKDKSFNFDKIINFLLFELGLKLTKNEIDTLKDSKGIVRWLEKYLWDKLQDSPVKKEIPLYLQVHKGRAIFYPTYFNKLSIEIINPHNRKTRAGTNPIHYEVVPKDTEETLQIVYIPFDAILEKDDDIKKQVNTDIKFLIKCIEKTSKIGIGAKEKLGWGQFEFLEKRIYCNKANVEIPEGWKNE